LQLAHIPLSPDNCGSRPALVQKQTVKFPDTRDDESGVVPVSPAPEQPRRPRRFPWTGGGDADARRWEDAQPLLLQLARRALADRDVDAVAAAAAELVLQVSQCDAVDVWELTADGGMLVRRAAAGEWPDNHPSALRIEEAPLGCHAISTGRTVVVERLGDDVRFAPPAALVRLGLESAVLVPTNGRHGVSGMVGAFGTRPGAPGHLLVDVLETVAELVGAVLARRRDEHELRLAEERYRTLVERAPIAIQSIDRSARIDAVNEYGLRLLGLPGEQAVGRSYLDLVADDDRPRVAMLLSQGLEGRASTFEFGGADGHRLFASSFIPLPGAGGDVERLLGVTQDVTESRRAERMLRASERRYRELVEDAAEAILTCDLDGRITTLNAAAESLLGLPRGTALGRPLADVVDAADAARVRELLKRDDDGPTLLDATVLRGGERLPVEASIRVVRVDGRREGLHVSAREVGERRRREARIREAQKLEALGRLAGGVAHDFNNLVTAIAGYAELAQAALPPAAERARADVQAISDAAAHAATLTGTLLRFSRRQVVERRRLDLAETLRGMTPILQRLAGGDVRLAVDAVDGCWVDADAASLEQIVLNLALNGRDAMPEGGDLTVRCERRNDAVLLAVADGGMGMDDAVRTRLFEPFFTTKQTGTGLGLATVYAAVDALNGTIDVDTAPGEGSTFAVWLPLSVGQPVATVLVVEDDRAVRVHARRHLEDAGYAVLEAADVEEALRLCSARGSIDLVLADVVLPGPSGPALAAGVARLRPQVRLLFMSGYGDETLRLRGVDPSQPLLAKPFTAETLVSAVRASLAPALSSEASRDITLA
jgi:PAS domain S-box-containing protein